MNKRSMILYYIVIPGFIIGLAYFFVATFYSQAIDPEQEKFEFTGELSLKVLDAKEEAENKLLYIDQSASLASQQALLDLAENGGFYTQGCGLYEGYRLWNIRKETCYPEYKQELKKHFKDYFSKYLSAYPEQGLSADIYEFSISEDKLFGLAYENLETPIFPMSKKIGEIGISQASIGKYIVKPDFKTRLRINIEEEFESLKKDAGTFLRKCYASEDKEQCVKDNKPDHLEYKRGTTDNQFFLFNKTTGTMLLDKNMELKPLTYKFALFLPSE